ncbi:MAG: hypothetical protein JWQ72_3487, partial [Polaromonas sp.]|nr:hypothetical protein [Polaromonas sp.]
MSETTFVHEGFEFFLVGMHADR